MTKTRDIYKPEQLTDEEKEMFFDGLDHFLNNKWQKEEARRIAREELKKDLKNGNISNEEYFNKVNKL